MVFELIRSEDEQFRDSSSDDEDDIPQFGQYTPDDVSVNVLLLYSLVCRVVYWWCMYY